jgi:8-oxo-dGTP diphosphatase
MKPGGVSTSGLLTLYKNMVRGVVTLAFRCYAVGGETHPTSEARQVAWLTVEEASRDMVEARSVRVADALSGNGPFVRVHDGIRLL